MMMALTSWCVYVFILMSAVNTDAGVLTSLMLSGNFSIIPSFIRSRVCRPPLGDICINIKKCPYFTKLLDDTPIPRPATIITIIVKHQCGELEGDIPKVCCFLNYDTPSTTTPTTQRTYSQPDPPANFLDDYMENTNSHRELQSHPNFRLLPLERCGSIASLGNRITNGKKTALEEFPWMALIAYNSSDIGPRFRCGGTLIHERVILTAAHCILNSSLTGVRLGEYDLSSTNVDCDGTHCSPPVQDFYIQGAIIHPQYNPKTFENDIALLMIDGKANFTQSNVQPICLPVGEINDDITGKFALVAGWGTTEEELPSSVPLKASVPVLPLNACMEIYPHYEAFKESQICAGGYKGQDSCAGDSGGPLMYAGLIEGSPKYIQYGIVSFGPRKCGAEGKPGIYTRVKSYLWWILDNLSH